MILCKPHHPEVGFRVLFGSGLLTPTGCRMFTLDLVPVQLAAVLSPRTSRIGHGAVTGQSSVRETFYPYTTSSRRLHLAG